MNSLHKQALIVTIVVALAGSCFATGPGSPPSGTMITESGVETWLVDTLLFLTTNGDTVKVYVNPSGVGFFSTTADSTMFNKGIVVTGNIRATGAVTMGTPTYIPIAGTTNLSVTGGNLTGNSSSSFGVSGFRFPYQATTAPTSEGLAMWNSLTNRLYVGDGATPLQFYPGAHTNDSTMNGLRDVDTAGLGDDFIPVWSDSAQKWLVEEKETGSGSVDTIIVFRTDHPNLTSGPLANGDTLFVDTTNTGDGRDSIWSLGADRDDVYLVGESDTILRVRELGDTTIFSTPDNGPISFANPLMTHYLLPYTQGGTLYIGGGAYPSAGGVVINQLGSAGSKVTIYNSTTEMHYFDTDSLVSATGTGRIKGYGWYGQDITWPYISGSGFTAGQVSKSDGAGGWYAADDENSGLWGYLDELSQWFTSSGDSVIITIDTVNDSAIFYSNVPIVHRGPDGSHPKINFGSGVLDSVAYDSMMAAAREKDDLDSAAIAAIALDSCSLTLAPKANPGFTGVIGFPSSDDPITDSEGQSAWDFYSGWLEIYRGNSGGGSCAIPTLQHKSALIYAPDGINDEVPLFRVDAVAYPHGITLRRVSITLPADAAYTMTFEEWAGDPPVNQNTIEAVSTGASDAYMAVSTTSIDDASIDAGDYVFLDIPATDVDWVQAEIFFLINDD